MIFRPRIFISSTLGENLSIRKKLETFYKSIGAEPMLYETNLTPSVVPASYRTDILDADFIIFILKNQYGTPHQILAYLVYTKNFVSHLQQTFQSMYT